MDNEAEPSTDVGLKRLLGWGGAMSKLDPLNATLRGAFFDKWESARFEEGNALLCTLERKCTEIWRDLENHVEISTESSGPAFYWLTRWISSFTLRCAGLTEGGLAFEEELGHLTKILEIADPTDERILRLEEEVQHLLGNPEQKGIPLSSHVALRGRWVAQSLVPQVSPSASTRLGRLTISFNEKDQIDLSVETFLWLWRKAYARMSEVSFPRHYLDSARDLLVEVASRSDYSVQNDFIELRIGTPDGECIILKRHRGHVHLQ
jgi:hypothetical protein